MQNFRAAVFLLVAGSVAVGGFLYNKQLDLEALKAQRAAATERYARQLECAAEGKKWAEQYFVQESAAAVNGRGLTAWDDPEYHYSEELGACLVKTRSVDMGYVTYQHARVTNILRNKPVLESYVKLLPTGKDDGSVNEQLSENIFQQSENLTRAEFLKRAAVVMSK